MVNANDSAPRYIIRDRDKIYGADFVRRLRAMGIEQVLTAPEFRTPESADGGKVIALPLVGGLHHRYTRRAA